MGAMKEIYTEIETRLQDHEWAELAFYLREGIDDREFAKACLIGAIELMAETQQPVNWATSEKVPARYLEHLEEANWHALHTLIEWQQGKQTSYTEQTLGRAYRALVNTLREGQ